MRALQRWASTRGRAAAFVASLAVFVAVQVAGYGANSKIVDLVCALILLCVAGIFHYRLVDGMARLDATPPALRKAPNDFESRICVTLIGAGAFLFSGLGMVMLVRTFIG